MNNIPNFYLHRTDLSRKYTIFSWQVERKIFKTCKKNYGLLEQIFFRERIWIVKHAETEPVRIAARSSQSNVPLRKKQGVFFKKGMEWNQPGISSTAVVLNFCPISNRESVISHKVDIRMYPFELHETRPAVIMVKANTWAKSGRLFPRTPKRFGRV